MPGNNRKTQKKHKKQCRKGAAKKRDNNDDASRIVDALSEELNKIVISDDDLFKDPPPKQECPICFLPMAYAVGVGVVQVHQPCCGKILCDGCLLAAKGEMDNGNIKECCPFCREPVPNSEEELLIRCKKRMEAGDAEALYMLGCLYENGHGGLPQDKKKGFELMLQAAKLGSINAHYSITNSYWNGGNLDEKNEEKVEHHYKLAAIGGHEKARHNLGIIEQEIYEDMDKAMKHYMISARAGYAASLKEVGVGYKKGYVTKDEYASALRAYKNSQDEMKSEQRTKATALNASQPSGRRFL